MFVLDTNPYRKPRRPWRSLSNPQIMTSNNLRGQECLCWSSHFSWQQPQRLKNLYAIDLCDLKSVDLYGLRSCSRLLSSNFSVISMASEVVILCLFLWPLWPLRPSKARTRRKAIFSHRRCDILQVTSYSGTCCVSKFIPFSPQNLNCFCAWGSSRSIIAASWNFCSRYSAQIYGPISGAASRESQDTNLLISILWKLP